MAAFLQEAAASDSDEEDDFIYNPLKLPLGWDGKPIPYWLYKLHGLNQEFQCEICGGATYWGRRAFERHFREYRHQAGMRLIGIPNTKNFYEITKVADAQKLWKNIQVCPEFSFDVHHFDYELCSQCTQTLSATTPIAVRAANCSQHMQHVLRPQTGKDLQSVFVTFTWVCLYALLQCAFLHQARRGSW